MLRDGPAHRSESHYESGATQCDPSDKSNSQEQPRYRDES